MIVAALFMIVSLVVIVECFRLGFGWEPQQGPQAGLVPFYLALLMFLSSAFIFYLGFRMEKKEEDKFFVNKEGMMEAIRIAITTLIFSVIVVYAGVYFAMLIFSPIFVRWLGKHSWTAVVAFTIIITLTVYFGMEVGLKIPLPRSPLYMQGKFII
jgi:putative tricarboxylic transport membrane protein